MPSPFDDLTNLMTQLPDGDHVSADDFKKALGVKNLDAELVQELTWFAMWQGKSDPVLKDVHICLLASSYENADSVEQTKAYIDAASKGRAPVNMLCVQRGLGLRVLEMAPEMPHKTLAQGGTAWDEKDCMAAIAFGMEATASGGDLLCMADLTFGAEQHAVALMAALWGCRPEDLTVDTDIRTAAADLIAQVDGTDVMTALEILQAFGGREIAGIIGGIIAARSSRLPVLVDGMGGLAACAVLQAMHPQATAHVKIASLPNGVTSLLTDKILQKPSICQQLSEMPGCGSALAATQFAALLDLQGIPDS